MGAKKLDSFNWHLSPPVGIFCVPLSAYGIDSRSYSMNRQTKMCKRQFDVLSGHFKICNVNFRAASGDGTASIFLL